MKKPVIHPSAFVADNATVRGSVTLGASSSVFFGAVLRGDRAPITIGAGTNIQDNCVVHVDYDHPDGSLAFGSPAKIKGQLDEVAIAELRQAALDYQKEAIAYKAEQEQ